MKFVNCMPNKQEFYAWTKNSIECVCACQFVARFIRFTTCAEITFVYTFKKSGLWFVLVVGTYSRHTSM